MKKTTLTEGTVKKGGQNPPNLSDERPPKPEGSDGQSPRLQRKRRFIRALAEYLAGTNQVAMSIGLEMGKPDAKEWAKVRSASPLFGYPTVDEAEKELTDFLG
jgi:hypothetical protein